MEIDPDDYLLKDFEPQSKEVTHNESLDFGLGLTDPTFSFQISNEAERKERSNDEIPVQYRSLNQGTNGIE